MAYLLNLIRYCHIRMCVVLILIILITNISVYFLLFAEPNTKVIALEEIPSHLVPVPSFYNNSTSLPFCEILRAPESSTAQTPMESVPDHLLDSLPKKDGIKSGGVWKPSSCVSRFKVAIVIPYRDRPKNLNDFLFYMHPFLQEQMLEYRIVIVEQTHKRPFNRAKLFNIGFAEAQKLSNYPCYIFHDIDLIPQSPNNIYACTYLPRHMSAHINVFDYKLPYEGLFGGAVAILRDQFKEVNGFSNTFFGWGGEDDDFYNRVTSNGTKICRYEPKVSKYIMLSHKKQKPSDDRFFFLVSGKYRFITDGLNSLKYTVLKLEMLPLYTRVLVDL